MQKPLSDPNTKWAIFYSERADSEYEQMILRGIYLCFLSEFVWQDPGERVVSFRYLLSKYSLKLIIFQIVREKDRNFGPIK